jgi:hypothetical protein
MATAQRRTARLSPPDEDGVRDLDVAPAAKQEAEAAGEYTAVPVGDVEIRVKPQSDWRMSDMRYLNSGDLDGWAGSVIHPDDLDDFMELDITMGEFRQFAEDSAKATGDSLGKSSRPSRSSKNTRRR